jgi:N-acetylglucosamine-6-sulfatase
MPRQGAARWPLVALVALLAASIALGAAGEAAGGKGKGKARPNVVVVMTDDQTLASMEVMVRTRALVGSAGATFADSFASYPLCCPSRATFLTGRYAHNHKVLNNIPPQGGFSRLRSAETLPVWLGRAGYYTGHIGKYLNGYEESPVGVPPGWSEFHGQKTQNAYYGYELQEGKQRVLYGDPDENPDDPADPASYATDVYTDKAVEFITRRSPFSQPFFLWVAYNAPHSGTPEPKGNNPSRCRGNAKPAARHIGAFEDAGLPQPSNYNEADVSDKPPSIRDLPLADANQNEAIRDFYRCELESLLAVDEGVQRIVDTLAASGELDRTVVIFTSDNGFFHGEHRIPFGKTLLYEESIRVPLLIRGPGIPAGVTVSDLAANVDLAPTILELAGAKARLPQDGRSLLRAIRHPGRESGRELVIESNRYEAVRTERYIYAEHERGLDVGARELYDLALDPYQLDNRARDPAYGGVRKALAQRLRKLNGCAGSECRTSPRVRLATSSGDPGCVTGAAVVSVIGQDAPAVLEAEFALRRRPLRTDHSRPHRVRVPGAQLRPGKPTPIRARVALRDGRLVDLTERVRRCG